MFDQEIWDCDILEKGDVVSGWRVERYLGEGGAGAVYFVTEINGGRSGTLKILKLAQNKGNRTERAKFQEGARCIRQECQLIAKLQSEKGLPKLYATGECKGRPYFIREYLEPIDPEALPSDNNGLCRFILQLVYSLNVLHKNGWVHCDVKPWNIARRSDDDLCVLIDLGSARKIEDGEHGDVSGLTRGYDAPETSFTPARDIYSVGHVIRDCFAKDVPPEWGYIINRCISNRPDCRYKDVHELFEDITQLQKGKLQSKVYWPLRIQQIKEHREIERSLAEAEECAVRQEELLKRDEANSTDEMTVFRIDLTRNTICHFTLQDPINLKENTLLIISGKGILDAEISGPNSSAVVLREFSALNNLTSTKPPKNDLTYVLVGPGSHLNFTKVKSDDYKRFFPGRKRILRDLDATTSFHFDGKDSFAAELEDTLKGIEESLLPKSYKKVLEKFFRGEAFTVSPNK